MEGLEKLKGIFGVVARLEEGRGNWFVAVLVQLNDYVISLSYLCTLYGTVYLVTLFVECFTFVWVIRSVDVIWMAGEVKGEWIGC